MVARFTVIGYELYCEFQERKRGVVVVVFPSKDEGLFCCLAILLHMFVVLAYVRVD